MILVTGATGNVGDHVVQRLAELNVPVRALSREKKANSGIVEWVQGDFNDAVSLQNAMTDIEKVVLISPAHEDMVVHQLAVLDAAAKAGVKHIVKLSGLGAGPEAPIRLPKNHYAIETKIQESGIAYTFVRPNLFMQVLIGSADSIKVDGAIYAPAGEGAISFTDVRDITEIIINSLTQPGHENAVYEITGPTALTYGQAAEILQKALGKPVQYVSVAPETARDSMLSSGMTDWLADAFLELFEIYRAGHGATVLSNTVTKVAGHSAHDFSDFAAAYRQSFQ